MRVIRYLQTARCCRIGAFGECRGVKLAHERFTRGGELSLQPAARREHASPAILAEAFHQPLMLLERAHDLAERDRLGWPRQRKAAAGAAPGGDEAAIGEVAHYFGQVVARDAEFGGDLAGRK
jgi:hypothetical protein